MFSWTSITSTCAVQPHHVMSRLYVHSLNVIDVASLLCKTRSANDFVAVTIIVSLNNGSKIHVT